MEYLKGIRAPRSGLLVNRLPISEPPSYGFSYAQIYPSTGKPGGSRRKWDLMPAEENHSGKIIRYRFEEVVRILEEARKPDTSIAQLCIRNQITPAILELWQMQYAEVPTGFLKRLCYLHYKVEFLERELQKRDQVILGIISSELREVIAWKSNVAIG